MNFKTQALIVVIVFIMGIGLGRYTNHTPASEVVTAIVAKQVETDKVTDKKTVIVKEPTGKQTTTIVEETHTTSKQESQSKTQDTIKAPPQIQVSALAGFDIRKGVPVYGAAASKQFLGPISLGVFGLTNGTVGVSIGMTF